MGSESADSGFIRSIWWHDIKAIEWKEETWKGIDLKANWVDY